MKKFFMALSVLAALMLSVVPSQALIGIPDDTAGTDAVVPILCDISGETGLNTLILFMDVGQLDGIDFHYTIYTKRSDTVFDATLDGTAGEIDPRRLSLHQGPGVLDCAQGPWQWQFADVLRPISVPPVHRRAYPFLPADEKRSPKRPRPEAPLPHGDG